MTDWGAPLDLYCERFEPGLFAEPWNAASNLAFVLAGVWLLANLPRLTAPRKAHWTLEVLAGLIILIGICSAAFHTFATVWAQAMDVGSIAAFIYFFMIVFARQVLDIGWNLAWMAAPAFWGFGTIITGPFGPGAFNGSVTYFPALAGLAMIAGSLQFQRRGGVTWFAGAAGLLLVSIWLRTMDLAWCERWPWGTHWAWHLINSLVLTLAVIGIVKATTRRR
jgi:hypothetical protein